MLIPNIKSGVQKGTNISTLLAELPRQSISYANWSEYPYKPDVSFAIAHDDENIYLEFFVKECCTAAYATVDDSDVHKDSCVEFFIALDDKGYYNYETNAIGTPKLHYKAKDGVVRAPESVMQSIKRESSLGNTPFAESDAPTTEWTMLLTMPRQSLFRHNVKTFGGLTATANFYKCGDNLSCPHFISWNAIDFPKPNFHLPEFFGTIRFE